MDQKMKRLGQGLKQLRAGRGMAALGAVAVLWVGGVWSPPAQARQVPIKEIAPGKHNCPPGYFCLWTDVNYGGRGVAFLGDAAHYHHLPKMTWIDDKASSAYNNGYPATEDVVIVYKDVYYTGDKGCLARGDSNPRLRMSDRLSSHQWVSKRQVPC